jgi:hypothetical protein
VPTPSPRLHAVQPIDFKPRKPAPLVHDAASASGDAGLRADANAYLATHGTLQVMAEVLIALRIVDAPWWTPEQLRARWPAETRLTWFTQRSDLRQEITTALTGLVFNTARRKSPAFQAELIDSVIEDSDIGAAHFEGAFDPRDLVVYGPIDEIWREIVRAVPWGDADAVPSSLMATLLEIMLADKSAPFALPRTPILEACDVRSAIDSRVWQTYIPLDIRAAIDDERLARERDGRGTPFLAADELALCLPKVIAATIPAAHLRGVFLAAGASMGFAEMPTRSDVAPSNVTLASSG